LTGGSIADSRIAIGLIGVCSDGGRVGIRGVGLRLLSAGTASGKEQRAQQQGGR
jgi:hypothetical protein